MYDEALKGSIKYDGLNNSILSAPSEKGNRDHLKRPEQGREVNGLCFFEQAIVAE